MNRDCESVPATVSITTQIPRAAGIATAGLTASVRTSTRLSFLPALLMGSIERGYLFTDEQEL